MGVVITAPQHSVPKLKIHLTVALTFSVYCV